MGKKINLLMLKKSFKRMKTVAVQMKKKNK